jgi:hypothetical protein
MRNIKTSEKQSPTGISKYMDMHKKNKARKYQYINDNANSDRLPIGLFISLIALALVTIAFLIVTLKVTNLAIKELRSYESQKYNIYLAERGLLK